MDRIHRETPTCANPRPSRWFSIEFSDRGRTKYLDGDRFFLLPIAKGAKRHWSLAEIRVA
jgi:hypothetical protein